MCHVTKYSTIRRLFHRGLTVRIIPKLTFYRERYGVVQSHANVIRQTRLRTKVQITIVAKKNIYSSKKINFIMIKYAIVKLWT